VYRIGSLTDRVNIIEFSPDGRYVAVVGLITREGPYTGLQGLEQRDRAGIVARNRIGGLSFAADGRIGRFLSGWTGESLRQ
jgi:hypothetical protein